MNKAAKLTRYRYADITKNASNFGNLIIDLAVRTLMTSYLPPPVEVFDAFTESEPLFGSEFTIIPGCTMLTAGHYPGLNSLDWASPVYCIGGSIWNQLESTGYLIRSRVILRRTPPSPDLSIARLVAEPVGVRDSYTQRILLGAGIRTLYVGCPTLFLSPEGVADDGYVLMSLGRGHIREQCYAGHQMAKKNPVIGICHELGDYERYRAVGWKLPLVTFSGDINLYLSYFKHARVVVTGRLHGLLPSIAFGKKVYYYGTKDSRTSICDDLGIDVHNYKGLENATDNSSNSYNRYFIEYLRDNMDELFKAIVKTSIYKDTSELQSTNQE
ncbi:MAG: polysaccharide pyruvyl transferase family protein [bacterium]|jgi:hypothetical protein